MSRLLPLAISMVLLIALLLNVSCGSVSRSTATATVTSTITTTQTPPATTTTQTLTTTTVSTTTTAHTLTLDPSLDLTFLDVTYIIITPGTVTIAAGGSQLYTVTAYDYEGYSFDVTRDCDFNVSRGASGSWFFNEYISENTGTWKVTGNYWNPTDGTEFWRAEATLIVKE
ncbi:MAG: hypothetical protein MUO92_01605 [Dehalococcoidales bacterium]|nr:hypothetical protein [Dehalococcoidales bacterium]